MTFPYSASRHPGLVPGSIVLRRQRLKPLRRHGCRNKSGMTVRRIVEFVNLVGRPLYQAQLFATKQPSPATLSLPHSSVAWFALPALTRSRNTVLPLTSACCTDLPIGAR